MLWIEAALAFAITMMILSTIVSVIIETGHRIFRVRETGLQQFMVRLHQDIIAPLLPAAENSTPQANALQTFVQRMTTSPFASTAKPALLDHLINAHQLTALSTREFISRLATTPEGQALYQQAAGVEINLAGSLRSQLAHITHHFDTIGNGASDYFKRRAGLYSLVIGIVLAFSCNINAPHLLQTFLADKDTRLQLVEKTQALDAFLQQQASVPTLGDLYSQLKDLQAAQSPFGWHSAPWSQSDWPHKNQPLALAIWGITILLSGILIGLGGPFWFDAYRKLGLLAGLPKSDFQSFAQNQEKRNESVEVWLALFEESIRASQLQVSPQSTTGTI